MRDFNKIMSNCIAELESIGLTTYSRDIIGITVNNRLSRSLGRCIRKDGTFRIEIARKTAADNVDIDFVRNVIMHEIIHTMPGCWNHGHYFQFYASIVNRKLGYHVSTTETAANMEAAGVKPIVKSEVARYALVCRKCGGKIYRERWCAALANPSGYRHSGCGGDLYTIILDPKVAIANVR